MRPALYAAAALALGIAVASWLRPHPALALAAVCAALGAFGFRQGRTRAAAVALVAIACFGALRYTYAQTIGRGNLAAWEGRRVIAMGTVTSEPEPRKPRGAGYIVTVATVDGAPARGRVEVTQWGGAVPGYGERVSLNGTLKPPAAGPRVPGGFDRGAWLARQGVFLTMESGEPRRLGPGSLPPPVLWAVALRHRLEGALKATMPPDDAALMAGLLFGTRTDLPPAVKEAFKESGVLHLLAVSGGNLAMLMVPLLWCLRMVGLKRRVAAVAGLPVVAGFVLLTGATPSVLRAGLMAGMVLVGDLLGRERNALNTLGAAVCFLLFSSPGLLFDTGFQLSAGATFGIVLFARPYAEWLGARFRPGLGDRPGGWAGAGLGVTLAAQTVVEPISLATFGATSLIAPVANLLVIGLVELLTPVGLAAAVIGALWRSGGAALGWLLRGGLWLLLFLVKAMAAVPFAYLQPGRLPWWGVVAWYGAVAALAVPAWRAAVGRVWGQVWARRGLPVTRAGRLAGLVALVVLSLWVWGQALADPADTLAITFLDVGQGDAIAVEAPGGHAMVVDVGVAYPADPRTGRPGFDAGREVVVPHLKSRGVTQLDYLVLTHPDADHAGGGAAVVNAGLGVGEVLYSGSPNATEKGFLAALAAANARGLKSRQPVAGERLKLGPEVIVEVLNPLPTPLSGTRSDDNANCVVLRLIYRQVRVLLTCDMEADTEAALLDRGTKVEADVLKAAHHGSGHSSTAPFLAAVRPRWAIISAGNGNPYGHPHPAALDRLRAAGATVLRTDRQGSITLRTDGLRVSFTGERSAPAEGYRPVGLLGLRWLRAW